MRHRMEETASEGNVKLGPGGIVDIEFLVQMLQLKHGRHNPEVRTPNTLAALAALNQARCLDGDDYRFFRESYRFLRTLEARLRLMNITARNRLPEDPTELTKLAHLLRCPSSGELLVDFERLTQETRRRFDRIFDAEAAGAKKR